MEIPYEVFAYLFSKSNFPSFVKYWLNASETSPHNYLERQNYRLAPVSNVIFFSKTDNICKIAIYKLYFEVEILDSDIRHKI